MDIPQLKWPRPHPGQNLRTPSCNESRRCLAKPNIRTTEYTECQAFCPVVRIGYSHSLTGRRVLLPPLWVQGGRKTRLRGKVGGPSRTTGQKASHSVLLCDQDRQKENILKTMIVIHAKPNYEHYFVYQLNP